MAEKEIQTYHLSPRKLEQEFKKAISEGKNIEARTLQEAILNRKKQFQEIKESFPGGIRL